MTRAEWRMWWQGHRMWWQPHPKPGKAGTPLVGQVALAVCFALLLGGVLDSVTSGPSPLIAATALLIILMVPVVRRYRREKHRTGS